jgi:hypothetical protein
LLYVHYRNGRKVAFCRVHGKLPAQFKAAKAGKAKISKLGVK